MVAVLPSDITSTGAEQGSVVALLQNIRDTLNEIRTGYTANRADITAIRTQVVALIADMATRIANHNTLATKLNADAGVTDTNYAAAGAITAVDPAAVTSAALTAAAAAIALTKG